MSRTSLPHESSDVETCSIQRLPLVVDGQHTAIAITVAMHRSLWRAQALRIEQLAMRRMAVHGISPSELGGIQRLIGDI